MIRSRYNITTDKYASLFSQVSRKHNLGHSTGRRLHKSLSRLNYLEGYRIIFPSKMPILGAKTDFSAPENLRKIEEEGSESLDADFPPGPLDLYRKHASFDWKVMRFAMEDEKILRFKVTFQLTRDFLEYL